MRLSSNSQEIATFSVLVAEKPIPSTQMMSISAVYTLKYSCKKMNLSSKTCIQPMGISHVIQNLAETEQIKRSFRVFLAVVKRNLQGWVNDNLPVPDSRPKTIKNVDRVRLNLPKLQQLEKRYSSSALPTQRGVFKLLVG